jgi:hypothetical protein
LFIEYYRMYNDLNTCSENFVQAKNRKKSETCNSDCRFVTNSHVFFSPCEKCVLNFHTVWRTRTHFFTPCEKHVMWKNEAQQSFAINYRFNSSKIQVQFKITFATRYFTASFFYGDFIYKLKKIKGNVNLSRLFVKSICKFKKKGYQHDIQVWWLTHLQLIIMLTSLVARRWQGFESLWRFLGKSFLKNLVARCVSVIPVNVFVLIWLQGLWSP